MGQGTPQLYLFDTFCLDVGKRLLLCAGAVVPLKSKDFELLLALVERREQVLSKEELMRRLWPDSIVEEGNLSVHVFALRRALGETPDEHRYIVTVPGRGYSFVAEVRVVLGAEVGCVSAHEELEPVGGAMPLTSRFYVERRTDAEFQAAVARRDSIVLVKGARQVGKTSLLARSLQRAREAGARVALTDFQLFNAAQLASAESFLLALAKTLAEQLELAQTPAEVWDAELGPSMNFTRYLRRAALGESEAHLVWGMDEVDRLFACAFGNEVFGLFRSWHNARSLEPAGPWLRLTLALAYATEAHLFITDIHQSPFNVGTRLTLEDFTLEQIADLNRRYGAPLADDAEVARYFALVGGHPYLARRGLSELVTTGSGLSNLEARAAQDAGPFGDHLRRLLFALSQDAALCEIVRGMMQGQPCPTAESFYRLRSAGVVVGETARAAQLRCGLYASYLEEHLPCSN
ncbi:MAG: helix-turn-helix transcriptional regulator [Acidobacteria bacterium]|nr:helix-turn-helix transcriptional regulator [Acidobacteriota bacterium]MBI3423926.1 helix-turn-helix transcriptional regulator [Acidobacteriota bacterium]